MTTFFVDDDASNGGDGSFNSPFQTIQAAANAASAGDTVEIRAGVYREQVRVPRSGSAANPITFRAYQGEEVVISGGDLVSGWTRHDGDIWRANVNWDANGNRESNTLFVDGQLRLEAKQFAENDLLDIDDWGRIRRGDLQASSFQSSDLVNGSWGASQWVGARVRHHLTDWIITERVVTSYNPATGVLGFGDSQSGISQKQDFGFYIYDTLNAVDKAGEWYKDSSLDRLYYQVNPGDDPNDHEIEFRRRGYGFDVRGRDHIHIDGITFRGVSVFADGGSDNNRYENSVFYAYNKGPSNNFGRMTISGSGNVFRDNEVYQTYGSAFDLTGTRNEVVNNHFHELNMSGLGGVINFGGSEHLVSYNTVQNFARSFADGYSSRTEYSYNLFEDGGNLSWDTGVFDSDGGNGNSSQSIFHHNVLRNMQARGIYEGFYGANNNAVIHHNLFYNWSSGGTQRSPLTAGGTDFRQAFHNTVIGFSPNGTLDARNAVQTRHNNNLQVSLERMAALGVDLRGNALYTAADFVNLAAGDLRLRAGSEAIDAGIPIPGINDNYSGSAPDAGALEFGQSLWHVGHDFTTPPTVSYGWFAVPGTNLDSNGQFNQGLSGWTTVSGSPNARDFNSWNLKGNLFTNEDNNSLTGSFRTQSVELTPGEAIRKTYTGLKPDTTYTVGAGARVITAVAGGTDYSGSSGSIATGSFRGQSFVTGLNAGEWVRFEANFGSEPIYDQIELLVSRATTNASLAGTTIRLRLDSPEGPVLGEMTDLIDSQTWTRTRSPIAGFSGAHSIYVSVEGPLSSNLAISDIRLLNSQPTDQHKLAATITTPGSQTVTGRLGASNWLEEYETLAFRTGPNATTATVTFANSGGMGNYLDRVFLVEGDLSQDRTNVARAFGLASQSSTAGDAGPLQAIDGSANTLSETQNQANSWWQVAFAQALGLGRIELINRDDASYQELSNFSVSIWDEAPESGGSKLWEKDYFSAGSVGQGGVLQISGDEIGDDGSTRMASVLGKVVRVQLNGLNNAGNGRLSLADVRVVAGEDAPAYNNLALQGVADQSSDNYLTGRLGRNAINGIIVREADITHTTFEQGWWQLDLLSPSSVDQLVVQNAGRQAPMRVSVWSGDPNAGGTRLWFRDFASVGPYQKIALDGNLTSGGVRLDSLTDARYVRIDRLNSGFLTLSEVQVWRGDHISIDTDRIEYVYDLGTPGSVESGSELITPESTGDASIDGAVEIVDRGPTAGDDASRDFIRGSQPATLNHAVANGRYRITLGMSDPDMALDNLFVTGEGVMLASGIDRPAGGDEPVVVEVDVTDGRLNLGFGDADPSDREWVVNRVAIARAPSSAPIYSPDGGVVSSGVEVTAINPDPLGLVYFTTDGSDPRLPDGNVSPSAQAAPSEGLPATFTLINNTTLTARTKIGDIWSPVSQQVFLTGQPLPGDYNLDGVVNAADYTVWRDNEGRSVTAYTYADGNGDGVVDEDDRSVWTSNYGNALSATVLIDSTVGNGSFEDWGAANSSNLLIAANGTVTIPGWSAQTVNNAGWIDRTSPAVTAGSASDGSRNAIAAGNAILTLNSEPLPNYTTNPGDIFTIAFDAGSKDGAANAYEVYLVFAGQDRLLASFSEDSHVTSAGMASHEFSYTASNADAGAAPAVKYVVTVDGSFSQAFVDNVRLTVEGINPALSLASANESHQESSLVSATESVEVVAYPSAEPRDTDDEFNADLMARASLLPADRKQHFEQSISNRDLAVRSAAFERWLLLSDQSTIPSEETLVGAGTLTRPVVGDEPRSNDRSDVTDREAVTREVFASQWLLDLNDPL